jgi:hypothetical protein
VYPFSFDANDSLNHSILTFWNALMFRFVSWLREVGIHLFQSNCRMDYRKKQAKLQGTTLENRIVPTVGLNLIPAEIRPDLSGYSKPSSGAWLAPAQVREAYGVGLITFGSGLGSVPGDGSGQTIAIVDPYDDPNIASDLQVFDQTFNLPAPPSFEKLNEYGSSTNLPGVDQPGGSSWEAEESLDVEWAHAIAPGANIVLVEANSYEEINTAVQTAENLPGVSVISTSWGESYEQSDELSQDMNFLTPSGHQGVTVTNASGDDGSSALGNPSTSPDVVVVGGTQLNLNGNSYGSETAWSGSTGGTSNLESEPVYQDGVQSTGFRTSPDVSFDASTNSPAWIYDSYDFQANGPDTGSWIAYGGTSLACPCWAGLIAIVDQGRALQGEGSLDGPTQTLPALYSLPASDFHDITIGSNGGYNAGPGYDEVTGLGSPVANNLVPDLANINFMSDGAVGQSYSQTITTASGTTVSYSLTNPDYSVTPASLGLDFSTNGNQLAITGNPTTTGTLGFEVTSTGSSGTTTQLETLTINPDLTLNPNPLDLPDGNIGTPYAQSITTAGGTGTVTLSDHITSFTKPAKLGLSFSIVGNSLDITGTPTANGQVTFTVTAKDAFGSVTEGYSVYVGMTLSPPALPSGGIGIQYDQTIDAAGGSGTTTVSDIITSSTTPADLGLSFNINGSELDITGTPTASGTISFNVVATDTNGDGTLNFYTLTIGLPSAPTVTNDPSNAIVDAGNDTEFTAAATDGNAPPLTVQWQISTDGGKTFTPLDTGGVYGNSVTSDTLTITGATADLNDDEYQAVFTNANNLFAPTTPATLTVDYAPSIFSDPADETLVVGGDTSFTAAATDGNPTPTTVQWQSSIDGGNSFSDLSPGGSFGSSVTSDTLTITGATPEMNGEKFRAVFSNAANLSTPSNPATLTVEFAPTVTSNPRTDAVNPGASASFTAAAADGYPLPTTVQWQMSIDGGESFFSVPTGGVYGDSATTNTLTITAANYSMSGYEYQAVFSNSANFSATTSAAILGVGFAPTVTKNPSSATVNAGSSATLTALAADGTPTPTAVQWQVSTDGGETFEELPVGGVYGNSVNTTTLTIIGATSALDGNKYRAVFGNSAYFGVPTASALLTVDYAPVVTAIPSSTTVDAGSHTILSAACTGNPSVTVQWQISTNGGKTFSNLAKGGVYDNTVSSTNLNITGATTSMNGDLYRAVFSNKLFGATTFSIATTSSAMLTVDYVPKITNEPTSLTVDASLSSWPTAAFSATASGGNPTPISVQWQISIDGGKSFSNIPANGVYGNSVNSTTLMISQATSALSGDKYRAVFSNAANLSVASAPATLTVDIPPSVSNGPTSQTINAGGKTSFTALASGNPIPTVQWQVSTNGGKSYTNLVKGGVYGNSVTTSTLTISGIPSSMNGYVYRAIYSNKLYKAIIPSTATTSTATLTVNAPGVIKGIKAGQKILGTATIEPFSSVTVTDPGNAAELQNVQVTLNNFANGTLTQLSGGNFDASTGVYTLDNVTLAQAQAALEALVFNPTQEVIPPGHAVITKFTIVITDVAGTATNDLTTVIVD